MSYQASIATNRFGLGAKQGQIKQASADPKAWLIKQLSLESPLSFNPHLPHSAEIFTQLLLLRKAKKARKKKNLAADKNAKMESNNGKNNNKDKNYNRKVLNQLSTDTLLQAINAEHTLPWRLLDFFSNHFSVSASGPVMAAIAPTLEREAIAPNLLGTFEELLLCVSTHPAMLIYLNNERSFGAQSKLGRKGLGLNENLAREILELHTLGVNGPYKQHDVIALANGITGWSVARAGRGEGSGFLFRRNGHQPGSFTLLNKTYTAKGVEQGKMMLRDLANHPKTAEHLCYKLAHHFISDKPSQPLLTEMVRTWRKTQGNIRAVMITMINNKASWQTAQTKFKTPREFVISSLRAFNPNKKIKERQLIKSLSALGQQPFNAGSPAGFGDSESDWNGGNALITRIDWSAALSDKLFFSKKSNVRDVITQVLGAEVSSLTTQTVLRAESKAQATTLLLMSPEFQRR